MIIIHTNKVSPLLADTCYQDTIEAIYNWHFNGPSKVIPGYWKVQNELSIFNDEAYSKIKTEYDNKSFDWATAIAGAETNDEINAVNEYFEEKKLINWLRVKKLIERGKRKIAEFSSEEQLGLIRYFNPNMQPLNFSLDTPAAIEFALRKYGPLFAAGRFVQDMKLPGTFLPFYHVIMVVGLQYNPSIKQYEVVYRDGRDSGVQVMSYDNYQRNLTQDPSAVLYYDSFLNSNEFIARGLMSPGTLFCFRLRQVDKNNYYFKDQFTPIDSVVELPGRQVMISSDEDISWLSEEEGYVYTAVPSRFKFEDLNDLSLTFCQNPFDAIKFLELNCKNVTYKTQNMESYRALHEGGADFISSTNAGTQSRKRKLSLEENDNPPAKKHIKECKGKKFDCS